jgi:hypothetical protein
MHARSHSDAPRWDSDALALGFLGAQRHFPWAFEFRGEHHPRFQP